MFGDFKGFLWIPCTRIYQSVSPVIEDIDDSAESVKDRANIWRHLREHVLEFLQSGQLQQTYPEFIQQFQLQIEKLQPVPHKIQFQMN